MPPSTPRTSIGLPDWDMVTCELWRIEAGEKEIDANEVAA